MSWKCLGVHTVEHGMEGYRCSQVWEDAMLHMEWMVIDIHGYVMEMLGECNVAHGMDGYRHSWVCHGNDGRKHDTWNVRVDTVVRGLKM